MRNSRKETTNRDERKEINDVIGMAFNMTSTGKDREGASKRTNEQKEGL